jgi:hypothetical protein
MGAFAFLRLYENATPHALLIRLAATFILLIFALSWRRRSTLDDSALIACALFGYGAAMLGGPAWLIGPVVLFLVHVTLWPRHEQRRVHTVYAVASVAVAGLLWLCLQRAYGGQDRFFFPYTIVFGAHLAIIGVSQITDRCPPNARLPRLGYAILAGWLLTLFQMIPLLISRANPDRAHDILLTLFAAPPSIALAAASFYFLLPTLYAPTKSAAAVHSAGFGCALIASLCAAIAG